MSRSFVGAMHAATRTVDIAIDGKYSAAAIRELIATEDYPLTRRLWAYTLPKTTIIAKQFLAFAGSDEGQRIVGRYFVNLNVESIDDDVCEFRTCSRAYAELTQRSSKHRQRLTVTFKFNKGANGLEIDRRAETDLERLKRFLSSQTAVYTSRS